MATTLPACPAAKKQALCLFFESLQEPIRNLMMGELTLLYGGQNERDVLNGHYFVPSRLILRQEGCDAASDVDFTFHADETAKLRFTSTGEIISKGDWLSVAKAFRKWITDASELDAPGFEGRGRLLRCGLPILQAVCIPPQLG